MLSNSFAKIVVTAAATTLPALAMVGCGNKEQTASSNANSETTASSNAVPNGA